MVSIAMPLVIVNLGAEMIYILDQRLKAQCIAEDKSCQVLNDVVRTWFDNKVIEALFKPQQLYSLAATREVFERLAHSSIMRLNSSRLLSDPIVQHAVDVVEVRVKSLYEPLPLGQWHMLRQTLCRFFQNRRIKVSLLMQEGIQINGAKFALPQPLSDSQSPAVGTITYYKADGPLRRSHSLLDTFACLISRSASHHFTCSHDNGSMQTEKVHMASMQGNPADFFQHTAPLGSNLYDRGRRRESPPEGRQAGSAPAPATLEPTPPSPVKEDAKLKTGVHELSLLATLIKPDANKSSNFKLNLFGNSSAQDQSATGTEAELQTLSFDDTESKPGKALAISQAAFGADDAAAVADEDDLLDLLDSVS